MRNIVIKILRVLAVVLFIGIIAAYICIPHSHMPDGIRMLLSHMKHSLSTDSNLPLILLIGWTLLLIVEIPFAFEVKNDNNVFADELRSESRSSESAPRHTAVKNTGNAGRRPDMQSARAKPTDKKAAAVKPTAEKKPPAKKPAAKQTGREKPKPKSQKAPERKPTAQKPTKTQVTMDEWAYKPAKKQVTKDEWAYKPTKAPAKAAAKSTVPQKKPASRPAPSPAANTTTIRPKAPSYTADYSKVLLNDESFDQFLNDLKKDYLNNN